MARPRREPTTTRGRRLCEIIDKRRLTISEAAAAAGVSEHTLRKAIHSPDLSDMTAGTLAKIAKWAKVKPGVLFPPLAV